MTALAQVFEYQATPIRVLVRDGDPLFSVPDVCRGLEHSNPSVALKLVDAEDRVLIDLRETDSPNLNRTSINPKMWFVTEPGFYTLALASQAPGAKTFRRWITHQVLPSIRKTGRYETAPAVPESFADALQLAANQARAIEQQQKAIAELEPRAQQADFHRAADGLISVPDFANKVKAWALREHAAKVTHQQVWDFLGDIRFLIRGNTIRHNQPTAWAAERDYVRVKETEYATNSHGTQTGTSPRLTPAGEGFAWDRAVRRIAGHGFLAPTSAVEMASTASARPTP
ncbi:phage antirepressor [Micromonospora sp. NPDC020750]|uniref:phage antirepressor n=1 Tax=unclassified Micromonospora TaxID=2617518 RepID=UPI003795C219